MDEGEYLLSHKSGESNIVILKGEKNSNLNELSKYYDVIQAHEKAPQIDTETIPEVLLKDPNYLYV